MSVIASALYREVRVPRKAGSRERPAKQSRTVIAGITRLLRHYIPCNDRKILTGLLLAATMPAVAAESPTPIGMSGDIFDGGFMLQFFAGLGLVLLCIVALAWLMKRAGGLQSSARGALRVVDGIALSARERIVLVQVGDKQVLLGVAPGRVNKVHVLDEPVSSIEPEESTAMSFAGRLRDALGRERVS